MQIQAAPLPTYLVSFLIAAMAKLGAWQQPSGLVSNQADTPSFLRFFYTINLEIFSI